MADPLYIVDGDNVMHARGRVDDHVRARGQLAADIAGWAARAGIQAVVVFDGQGGDSRIGSTQVTYSRRDSADTVIERMAYRHGGGREVTVVSSDRVVRHVAQRGGVHAMSAREFLDRLGAPPEPVSGGGPQPRPRRQIADVLDPATRAALERMRRGE